MKTNFFQNLTPRPCQLIFPQQCWLLDQLGIAEWQSNRHCTPQNQFSTDFSSNFPHRGPISNSLVLISRASRICMCRELCGLCLLWIFYASVCSSLAFACQTEARRTHCNEFALNWVSHTATFLSECPESVETTQINDSVGVFCTLSGTMCLWNTIGCV